MKCLVCEKPIEEHQPYITVFINHVRFDFHLICKDTFYKDYLDIEKKEDNDAN